MMGLNERTKALGGLVVVAFGYSLLSVFSRWLSLGFAPFTQVYLRLLGALLLSLIVFRKKIRFVKIATVPKNDWLPLLMMGVLGYGLMVYFVTMGALRTSLLNVSVILATVPFFSYIMGIFFLKDKWDSRVVGLAVVSMMGVSITASNSWIPRLSNFGSGELFVLVSAFLLAIYSVGRKLLSDHLNNQEITITVIGLALVTTWMLAIISGEELNWHAFWIPLVMAGLIGGSALNIICTFLESYSFEKLPVVVGNQMLLLENLFSPIIGYFMYREGVGVYQLVGAMIIVGSVYVNNKLADGD
jgi:drug/metabolite transporter (DMT)-like permease